MQIPLQLLILSHFNNSMNLIPDPATYAKAILMVLFDSHGCEYLVLWFEQYGQAVAGSPPLLWITTVAITNSFLSLSFTFLSSGSFLGPEQYLAHGKCSRRFASVWYLSYFLGWKLKLRQTQQLYLEVSMYIPVLGFLLLWADTKTMATLIK